MAERGIEPGCTVFTPSEIRVALLPIGNVPQDVWEQYATLVTRFTQMELSVTRSFYHEQQKSPFTHLPWNTGALHFKYLQGQEVDPAVAINKRASLSACHKVLGVIGICHCPTHEQINEAYEEFEQKCKAYPDAFTVRCFAFEPSDSHVEQDGKSAAFLIMFPPDNQEKLEYHLGVMMNDFAACLLMELEKWMLNASPAMVEMTTWLDNPEFAVPVSTLQEVQNILINDEEVAKKRRHGRLRKAMGDHCLLAGSPKNALDHYATAIELSRAVNDFIWLGAAQEGYICSLVMNTIFQGGGVRQKRPRPDVPSLVSVAPRDGLGETSRSSRSADHLHGEEIQGKGGLTTSQTSVLSSSASFCFGSNEVMASVRKASIEAQVRELMADAQAAYRKPRVSFLQIELNLKLSRFLAGLRGFDAKKEVLDLVSSIIEASKSVQRPEDRLVATMEAAEICSIVGAGRKQALLTWRAVELSRNMKTQNTRALAIIRQALLPVLARPGDRVQTNRRLSSSSGQSRLLTLGDDMEEPPLVLPVRVNSSWPAVHCGVLEALLGSSTRTMAHREAWRAAATILCHHANRLSEDRQKWLLDTLKVASKSTDRNVLLGPGPPPLVTLTALMPPSPWLRPFDVARRSNALEQGPFIFSALASRNSSSKQAIQWVCNEECEVHVEVSNPCALPLSVERMSLAGFYEDEIAEAGNRIPYPKPQDFTRWKGTAVTVKMPARTPPSKLSLTGIAKKPGRLVITGCYIQMFGVTWHQPWQEKGNPGDSLREEIIAHGPSLSPHDPFKPLTVEVVPPLQLMRGSIEGDRLEPTGGAAVEGTDSNVSLAEPNGENGEEGPPATEKGPTHTGKPAPLQMAAFEGEIVTWKLVITNIGHQSITAITASVDITEATETTGGKRFAAAEKRAGRKRPPLSIEVDQQALRSSLPLEQSMVAVIPVTVRIGEGGGKAESMFKVLARLEYLGEDEAGRGGAEEEPKDTRENPKRQHTKLGRCLELPVTLAVRRMLRVRSCAFSTSDVIRTRSVEGPKGEEGSCLATTSKCCMELEVENMGDRCYRAWVGPWVAAQAGNPVEGAVSVSPNQGSVTVLGLIDLQNREEPRDGGKAPSEAQQVAARWGLHWEQLPVEGEAATSLPRGFLPLKLSTVEAAMTPDIARLLSLPALEVEYSAAVLGPSGESVNVSLQALDRILKAQTCRVDAQIRPSSMLGCSSKVGEVVQVTMSLFNHQSVPMSLQANIQCFRALRFDPATFSQHQQVLVPLPPVGTDYAEVDCMAVGTMDCLTFKLPPEGSTRHSFGVCFLSPGLYEIGASQLGLPGGGSAFPVLERKLFVMVGN